MYVDSPLSYLVEGQAKKFYQGVSGHVNDVVFDDHSLINYFVIEPRWNAEVDDDGHPIADTVNLDYQDHHQEFHGTRLVGVVPCSDAFGVDLAIEKYSHAIQKKGEVMNNHHENLRRMTNPGDKVEDEEDLGNTPGVDTFQKQS